jgi:hypothetical protein
MTIGRTGSKPFLELECVFRSKSAGVSEQTGQAQVLTAQEGNDSLPLPSACVNEVYRPQVTETQCNQ